MTRVQECARDKKGDERGRGINIQGGDAVRSNVENKKTLVRRIMQMLYSHRQVLPEAYTFKNVLFMLSAPSLAAPNRFFIGPANGLHGRGGCVGVWCPHCRISTSVPASVKGIVELGLEGTWEWEWEWEWECE